MDALLEAMQPWLGQGSAAVLHGPMRLTSSHNETVLIVRDPDAHEICFVDARGLQNCSLAGERPVSDARSIHHINIAHGSVYRCFPCHSRAAAR